MDLLRGYRQNQIAWKNRVAKQNAVVHAALTGDDVYLYSPDGVEKIEVSDD